MSTLFVLGAWRVYCEGEAARDRRARQLFGFSILYLFTIFAMLLVDGGGMRAAGLS